MTEIKGAYNNAKIFADEVESSALEQVQAICDREEFKDSKIRMMSDIHAGKGCCIGTTMTLVDKVVPSMVGVDIGCGMLARKVSTRYLSFGNLDYVIRKYIPCGRNVREDPIYMPDKLKDVLLQLKCQKAVDLDYARHSLGTLGGGNHFIEMDIDSHNDLWIVIHSGSRHLGLEVATYYQKEAIRQLREIPNEKRQEIIDRLKAEGRQKEIATELAKLRTTDIPDDLAYITGDLFQNYIHDMKIAQMFAAYNRWSMMAIICHEMNFNVTDEFETVHNYIDTETMVLRKGATSAKKGERVLIPINMRDGSLICIGKGNPDWNESAPHGAGRIMSRAKARELSMDEYRESMKGIWTSCIGTGTLDESPMAYKSIESIVSNIEPTVDIIDRIKPVYNFKAEE